MLAFVVGKLYASSARDLSRAMPTHVKGGGARAKRNLQESACVEPMQAPRLSVKAQVLQVDRRSGCRRPRFMSCRAGHASGATDATPPHHAFRASEPRGGDSSRLLGAQEARGLTQGSPRPTVSPPRFVTAHGIAAAGDDAAGR